MVEIRHGNEPSETVDPVGGYDPHNQYGGYPPPTSSSPSTGGGIKAFIPVALGMVITFFAVLFLLKPVSTDTLKSNMDSVAGNIASVKTSISDLTGKVTAITQDINGVKVSLGNYATRDNLNTVLTTAQASIANTESEIKSVRDSLSKYASTDEVKALQTSLIGLTTQLAADEAIIKQVTSVPTITSFTPTSGASGTSVTITGTNFTGATAVSFGGTAASSIIVNSATQIVAVVGSGSTGSVAVTTPTGSVASALTFTFAGSSGSLSGTAGQLTATVIGNVFTGAQYMSFGSGLSSSSSSATIVNQSFSFQVDNQVGRTVTNVQFAIGLEFLGADSNILMGNWGQGLPSKVIVTLASSGTMTPWVFQSTGYPYIYGYTNSATTGIFGGIGAISQSSGTATYTVSVTITNPVGEVAVPPFNVLPIVKVMGYS
jgi:hypothetical protein